MLAALWVVGAPVGLLIAVLAARSQLSAVERRIRLLEAATARATGHKTTAAVEDTPAGVGTAVAPQTPAPIPTREVDGLPATAAAPIPAAFRATPAAGRPIEAEEISPPANPDRPRNLAELLGATSNPAAAPAPENKSAPISWELWLGVRGAGLLGGVAAALAGILLFRHAMEVGWITPRMRVGAGIIGGALVAWIGDRLRPKGYRAVPEALMGAGAVANFAALWAAAQLYALWPMVVSFGGMALVTAVLCSAAVRRRSTTAAVFALVGGFLTPLLLSTGEDRPVALFGYLLVLNSALLIVGRRLALGWLGLLALLATAGFQWLWLSVHFDGERLMPVLGMFALFALLFAFAPVAVPASGSARREEGALATRWVALLLPFGFTLSFLPLADMATPLWPFVAFAAILLAAASWLSSQPGLMVLPIAAACAASVLVIAVVRSNRGVLPEPEFAALALPTLALVVHLFLELNRRIRSGDGRGDAALEGRFIGSLVLITVSLGLLIWTLLLDRVVPTGAAAVAVAVSMVLAVRRVVLASRNEVGNGRATIAGLLAVLGVLAALSICANRASFTSMTTGMWSSGAAIAASTLFWFVAARRARSADGLRVLGAASVLSGATALALLGLLAWQASSSPVVMRFDLGLLTAVGLLLAASVALHGGRHAALGAGAAAIFALAVLPVGGYVGFHPGVGAVVGERVAYFAAVLLVAGAVAAAPFLAVRRGGAVHSLGWWAVAAIGPIAAAASADTAKLLSYRHGESLLAIALAIVPAALAATQRGAPIAARSLQGMAVIVLVAGALARWIAVEDGLVFLALTAAGFGLVWRLGRASESAGAGIATSMFLGLSVLLLALSGSYWERDPSAPLGVMSFAHGVSLAGLLFLAWSLASPRAGRGAGSDSGTGEKQASTSRTGAVPAAFGALVAFVWLSLAVIAVLGTGKHLCMPEVRDPRLDLALSLAWAAYGLALLVLGLARKVAGPRWASLAILFTTIVKVFLLDLGHLEGLARVASLGGLALSLTLVSLLYQRFVFGRSRTPDAQGPSQ